MEAVKARQSVRVRFIAMLTAAAAVVVVAVKVVLSIANSPFRELIKPPNLLSTVLTFVNSYFPQHSINSDTRRLAHWCDNFY